MIKYLVEMSLSPVPREIYLEKGKAENDYAQSLMSAGTIEQFYVSEDHKHYWIIFNVESKEQLEALLQQFPFYAYFNYRSLTVIDMVSAIANGLEDPNLNQT